MHFPKLLARQLGRKFILADISLVLAKLFELYVTIKEPYNNVQ